ncbi:MAG: FlgD immunoglobulin-like domain containing protein [Candidatus Cyclobacteriaceae bacterium M3_2C_046]
MKKNLFYPVLFILLLIAAVFIYDPAAVPSQPPTNWLTFYQLDSVELARFVEARSAIGNKENPQERFDYEMMMLVDPVTGKIPDQIKEKEVRFARKLPDRDSVNRTISARSTRSLEETGWEPRGPINVGGRTRALGIDIRNEKIILAGGVSGGMWRSEDGGLNWNKVTSPQSIHSVTCLVQDTRPGRQDTWYYGTGEFQGNSARGGQAPFRGDGLFKSTDNGLTWQLLPATGAGVQNKFNSQFQYVWNIAINPVNFNQDEVLVAAYGGILRSVDGGVSWDAVIGKDLIDSPGDLNMSLGSDYTEIAISSQGEMYAVLSEAANRTGQSADRGIYYSSNGINWLDITPDQWPQNYQRTVMGIAPSDPNLVYFICDSEPYNLWKFTKTAFDGTRLTGIWQNLSNNVPRFGGRTGDYDSQGSYNMVIKVHPEDENVVFLGGTNLYRSTDGFSTRANTGWIGGYDTLKNSTIYPGHYVDQHALVFYPSDPDKMLTGNDGGVQFTFNNMAERVNWTSLNNGFITSQFYTVAIDHSQLNDVVIGGMQDNGSYLTLSPGADFDWHRILGGDGGYCAVSENALFYYFSFQKGEIYRTTINDRNKLSSFARIDPVGAGQIQGQEFLFINPFVLDPNNNNVMYLAGGNQIWRNENLSQIPTGSQDPTDVNWKALRESRVLNGSISALSVSQQPADVLYYGSNLGEVFKLEPARSDDPVISNITSYQFPDEAYVSHIAVDPSNADRILVIFSNYNIQSLFFSKDGGATYEPVGGNLEENPDGTGSGPSIRWGQIIPLENNQWLYLLGTSTGVYSTTLLEGHNTLWVQEGASEIGNVVAPMLTYRSLDGTVVVSTHGNGVFTKKYQNVKPIDKVTSFDAFRLSQGYPNPFSRQITFRYAIPQNDVVKATVYNPLGQEVRSLLWAFQYAGPNIISWDGTNEAGHQVNNGVYIISLEYQGKQISQRVFYRQ